MRLLLVAAALTAAVAGPAVAGPPDPPYECVTYPCYPSDYPPFLLDRVRDVVDVTVNPGYNCVTEPCDQPPLVTACLLSKTVCTE